MNNVDILADGVELLGYLAGWFEIVFVLMFFNTARELRKAHAGYVSGDYEPKKRIVIWDKRNTIIMVLGLVLGISEYLFTINTVG